MAVTWVELRDYVGAGNSDFEYLTSSVTAGTALVAQYTGVNVLHFGAQPLGVTDIPWSVLDRAVLEVSSELFHRRQAPNGVAQFATPDGASPIRVARDPMTSVYPILTPFMRGGIA